MTRRHDALIPLTHDHHQALKNARMLREGAAGDAVERVESARRFVQFFHDDSVQHFREEEERLFPVVIDKPGAPVEGISRVLVEHVRLHALTTQLDEQSTAGEVDPALMLAAATLLKQHVRFEEDELFPAIEVAAREALAGLRFRQHDDRQATGRKDG